MRSSVLPASKKTTRMLKSLSILVHRGVRRVAFVALGRGLAEHGRASEHDDPDERLPADEPPELCRGRGGRRRGPRQRHAAESTQPPDRARFARVEIWKNQISVDGSEEREGRRQAELEEQRPPIRRRPA